MPDDLFERYIKKAITNLPKEFKDKLDNVGFVVEERAAYSGRSLLLGLYQGVPQTRRGTGYGVGGTLPDKITIFKGSILQIARTEDQIKNQVRNTILHEIGHHFGMSEEQVRRAQQHRRR